MIPKENKYRKGITINNLPKEVKKVLDLDSRGEIFKGKYKKTTLYAIEDAEINQGININQKLNFKTIF